MALTLNQIIARLRTLALSHDQVNDFFFGKISEYDDNPDYTYPVCFLTHLKSDRNTSEHLQNHTFRISFFDLVGQSEDTKGNEIDVVSDMDQVCGDFLAMLRYSGYQDDWIINDQSTSGVQTEQLDDMVAGAFIEFTVGVDYIADRCQVPASDVTFEDSFDMARTKILTYTGTGSEGATFTPTGLAGKIVLAVYRAGMYKRAIVTTPDDESVKIVGTDLGSYKGILSTTGSISLRSGDSLINGEKLDFIIYA